MEGEPNKCEDRIEEDYHDDDMSDMYNYCPICGVDWNHHKMVVDWNHHKMVDGKTVGCDKGLLLERCKPLMPPNVYDIRIFSVEHLEKIIRWQDLKIRFLENPDNVYEDELINFNR